MKVKILRDRDWRISSGLVRAFRANTEVNVPKAIGKGLIDAGDAEAIEAKPAQKPAKGD
ncbi:hypothetical protein HKCCE4037_06425 [Rhodobacterales bacterium HKCCE4037]|nr:hypothetical protein [Rhodobacterales bacterium HKCCE4037]